MDLLEYQGKQLFAKHGIAVPSGEVAANVDDAVAAAERIGYPCAIKAQVLIGGRGKAGGIKIAKDAAEAREYADAIIGMDIVGPHGEGPFRVESVWVEGGSDIAEEYYASVILDRGEKKLLTMVSAKGGMDIEAVAAEDPDALVKVHVDPTAEFDATAARPIVEAAGLAADALDGAADVLAKLAEVASEEDATLIEVNPLIVTAGREVVALDSKVTIDGNSLFRHQDLAEIADTVDDPQEQMAKEKGLTYVKLDGNVGILANGAGLCMSTLDVVAQAGGAPANFLDAGGGSKAEAIVNALEVIKSDAKVTAILFNIFGGITRCDEIAKGIVTASGQIDLGVPLVVRLDGTNSEEGLKILAEANLPDRGEKKLLTMVSAKGGMDIEAVAAEDPDALVKVHVDPTAEFDATAARPIVEAAGLAADALDGAADVLAKLAEVASEEDATLIEVNPLIVTAGREVVALDSKVTIDGNSLFRHQDLAEIADTVDDPQEQMAKEKGLTYVKLDGNVGILANGAGLCMSTLDVVAQAGGAPANFLDAGGGSKAEAIVNALEVIKSDAKVTAILFNIFGGITRCDEIAKGIVTASGQIDLGVPLVVRLDGTNSEEGLKILAEANLPDLHQEKTMLDAARRVVELAGSAS